MLNLCTQNQHEIQSFTCKFALHVCCTAYKKGGLSQLWCSLDNTGNSEVRPSSLILTEHQTLSKQFQLPIFRWIWGKANEAVRTVTSSYLDLEVDAGLTGWLCGNKSWGVCQNSCERGWRRRPAKLCFKVLHSGYRCSLWISKLSSPHFAFLTLQKLHLMVTRIR